MTSISTTRSPGTVRRIPLAVWLVAAVCGVIGALLAEPGDVWGNTVPSAATFFVAGFALGLAGWGVQHLVRRSRS